MVKKLTTKQLGDAAEFLVAGMMTLAGIPTTVMPDNWPDYDLIAAERTATSSESNVKSLRQVATKPGVVLKPGDWDWFAFVSLLRNTNTHAIGSFQKKSPCRTRSRARRANGV